jgi:hypothetical protein
LVDNSTCADQKTEANFTIYYDMHKFEGQEWIPPSIQSEESIKRMQLERFQRRMLCVCADIFVGTSAVSILEADNPKLTPAKQSKAAQSLEKC